jgi:hypothetical protein
VVTDAQIMEATPFMFGVAGEGADTGFDLAVGTLSGVRRAKRQLRKVRYCHPPFPEPPSLFLQIGDSPELIGDRTKG